MPIRFFGGPCPKMNRESIRFTAGVSVFHLRAQTFLKHILQIDFTKKVYCLSSKSAFQLNQTFCTKTKLYQTLLKNTVADEFL